MFRHLHRTIVVAAALAMATPAVASAWQQHAITDQRGKTFTFSEPAQRVVTIAIPLLWTFITVDGSDARVVGANAVAASQQRDGIVDRIFPRVATVPTRRSRAAARSRRTSKRCSPASPTRSFSGPTAATH